jgi:hypothetical protein
MLRFILLLLFPLLANAQTVGLHTISHHEHAGFNNSNPGLYIREDNGLTFGFYRNSYSRESVYLGYTTETRSGAVSAALTVGAVTGYPAAKAIALVVPSVAYHFGNNAVRVGIIPRPPKTGASAALHLMIETHI